MCDRRPTAAKSTIVSLLGYPLSATISSNVPHASGVAMRGFHLFGRRDRRRDERPRVALIGALHRHYDQRAALQIDHRLGLCARCVRPSFILAIFASGSLGFAHSLFEGCFFRLHAKTSRVGVVIPEAAARRGRYACEASPVSRRTILCRAELASNVVASIAIVRPFKHAGGRQTLQDRSIARFHLGDLIKSY